jgi:hypothetical protein
MRRTRWAALGLAVALCWPAAAPAEELLELKLKAAFVYNFARLTTWPAAAFADPATPLEACILDNDPVAPALQQAFAGKVVEGHRLTVRRLAGAAGWENCHIAYLGAGPPDLTRDVLRALAERSVLTVHEQGAAQPDGVIRLFLADRKLRFEVNQTAAERAQLRLNARLMALAVVVRAP